MLLQTAEIQPTITPDMLGLLTDRVTTISNRVPALKRSVQESKLIGVYYEPTKPTALKKVTQTVSKSRRCRRELD